MIITHYDPNFDKLAFENLLDLRKMDVTFSDKLPKVGYVVYNNLALVAAGFLRQCENSFGLLDSYITNPNCSNKQRHQALELITKQLIQHAKLLNIKELICLTADSGILKRSLTHGFVKVPLAMSLLSLS